MIKKCCAVTNSDLGILVIRFSLALVFIIHGLAKFQNMQGTLAFFTSLSIWPAFAYLVAGIELFGGILLLVGFLTPWMSLALGLNMMMAILLVKINKPFLGGYEYDLTLMLASLGLSLLGTGKYTICPCGKDSKK
ncbi:MAG: DoxX family protein [Candidatus Taylorbacteria bacterium]|nr:DoxX family protein [Candidatus Taylorbacteria bacterium]